MKTYAIYHPARTPAGVLTDPDKAVFVKEGPAWPAIFVPFVWALWHRLWLVGVCLLALELGLAGLAEFLRLTPGFALCISLLVNFLIALEANELRQWTLEGRGYSMVGLVTAASVQEAELAYFDQLITSSGENKPERAPLKTSLRLDPAPQDGLFPASGV